MAPLRWFRLAILLAFSTSSAIASEYSQLITQNSSGIKLGSKPGLDEEDSRPASDSREISVSGEDIYHEVTVSYPGEKTSSFRIPREGTSSESLRSSRYRKQRSRKIHPGQYADKRKNQNWKHWPEYSKSSVSPSDSKIAWSYWEEDEHEGWEPDDADDSKPAKTTTTSTTTTTTTTTTTAAPTTTTTTSTTPAPTTTTTKAKPPVSIHKHFHYFKKTSGSGGPWKGDTATTMPTTAMPMEEMMMKMPEEMMMEMMMKGMMTMPPAPQDKGKGGISSIFDKLSKVDPITVLVAGIVPASLILAAALPSVMHKVMKGGEDGSSTVPMVTTTAVSNGDDMMAAGSRSSVDQSMSSFIEAVGKFGKRALERPHCAKEMLCKFAIEQIVSDSPVVRRAVQIAAVAMEDSWLDHLGVRSIFNSINEDACNQIECEKEQENFV